MRLLSNPRTRTRLAAAAAAFAAGTSLILAATPAQAAPPGADLEFRVVGDKVTLAGRPYFVQVFNRGPATADTVVVKVNVAGIDTAKVEVDPPSEADGCSSSGLVFTCNLGSLLANEHDNDLSPFGVIPLEGAAAGSAGSFTVEVSSTTPDPNPANNQLKTVAVDLVNQGTDLFTLVNDVWKAPAESGDDDAVRERVAPGTTAPLVFTVFNFGTTPVTKLTAKITLPPFVTFPPGENFEQCTYLENRSGVDCVLDKSIEPDGGGLTVKIDVLVAADAPGPMALDGGIVDAVGNFADAAVNPAAARGAGNRRVTATAPTPEQRAAAVQANAASQGQDKGTFSVHTAANPANLGIVGGSAQGAVNSTVTIAVKATNDGPASSPASAVKITAPSGTELVSLPVGCQFDTPGKVATCVLSVTAKKDATMVFSFKILSGTVGSDGKAEIAGPLDDPNNGNNSAALTITVTGGLPITGANATLIGGVGLGVLLAGLALYFAARRRRVVLITPVEDR